MRTRISFSEVVLLMILLSLSHYYSVTSREVVALPLAPSPSSHNSSHRLGECDALLRFSNSFTISSDASWICDIRFPNTSYPKTASWKNGTDCCSWDGVTCHAATNHVIGLDLSCSHLRGVLRSNSTIFSLRNLHRLNLAGNHFSGSRISPRFGIFTRLTHLNLSNSYFSLKTALESISRHLSKLISLDLSSGFSSHSTYPTYSRYFYYLGEPSIEDDSLRLFTRNLTQLKELVLDGTNLSRFSPISLTNLSSTLTSLSLRFCHLRGEFPLDVFHLPSLRSLALSSNRELMGILPQTNWTSNLVFLYLILTGFHGSIPTSLEKLTALNYLDLSYAEFTGPVQLMLGSLSHLIHLDLSYNSLSSVDFWMLATIKNLQYLSLAFNNLTVLSQSNRNNSFPMLQVLDLRGCNLTELPYTLASLEELRGLDLSFNMIGRQIPEWILRAPRDTLTSLDLSYNNFSGEIPSLICRMSSLAYLDLSSNVLSGTIPGCFWNLSSLSDLRLEDNQLQGQLPRSLSNCTRLQSLSVYSNGIYDTFPYWLNANPSLEYLTLESNKFHGVIGIPLPHLTHLHLAENNFSGHLPRNFFYGASSFDLSKNNFEGPLPILPPTVAYIDVSHNMFNGGIEHQFCIATGLRYMDISFNRFTSTIPHRFINFNASVVVLDIQANRLAGQIPEIFNAQSRLSIIQLSENQFSGILPQSLSNCEYLEVLDLCKNEFDDSFPCGLETLPHLKVLSLKSNKFHGPVIVSNKTNIPFSRLHIFDLSENKFSSPLPSKYIASLLAMKDEEGSSSLYMEDPYGYGSITMDVKGVEIEMVRILTEFVTIDFSNNLFHGEIPEDIGDLKSLKGLNFSHNSLSGNIPSSMGNLTNLESLDLSSNKLDGEIPGGLAKLSELSWLNLLDNQLVGQIPQGMQFDTFPHSFDGNPSLCGHPLPNHCEDDAQHTHPSIASHEEEETQSHIWIERRAVPVGYVCGLVFGFLAGYAMLERRRPSWLMRMVERR